MPWSRAERSRTLTKPSQNPNSKELPKCKTLGFSDVWKCQMEIGARFLKGAKANHWASWCGVFSSSLAYPGTIKQSGFPALKVVFGSLKADRNDSRVPTLSSQTWTPCCFAVFPTPSTHQSGKPNFGGQRRQSAEQINNEMQNQLQRHS